MLDMVRADKNAYIYCHRKVLSILADVGKARPSEGPTDQRWTAASPSGHGVPIVTSYNFVDGARPT